MKESNISSLSNLNKLDIPNVNNMTNNGAIYDVDSVEMIDNKPVVHIKDEGSIITYLLPNDLCIWVEKVLYRDDGYLPALIEFKNFNNQYMAYSLSSS